MKRPVVANMDPRAISTLAKEMLFTQISALSHRIDKIRMLDEMTEDPFFLEVADEFVRRQRDALKVNGAKPVKGLLAAAPEGRNSKVYKANHLAHQRSEWKKIKAKSKKFATLWQRRLRSRAAKQG